MNEDLGEPGAEHDDDYGARVLNATGLDDFLLDVVDTDAGDRGPGHRQYQQHDNRALSADDQHDDGKKCNEQRNACPKVHCLSLPRLPAVLAAFCKTSLAQEFVAGEGKMFARADARSSRIVSCCVAISSARCAPNVERPRARMKTWTSRIGIL